MEHQVEYLTQRNSDRPFADLTIEDTEIMERLDYLIAENRKTKLAATGGDPYNDEFEAAAMRRPVTTEKALSYFGLAIGGIVPTSLFIWAAASMQPNELAFLLTLSVLAIAGTAAAGFATGKWVGQVVRRLESMPIHGMLALSVLVGLLWGIISGAAGGVFLFGIGALFGGAIGGITGAAALPPFVFFHRILKRGDVIELKHLLPVLFGITFTISAAIFGN